MVLWSTFNRTLFPCSPVNFSDMSLILFYWFLLATHSNFWMQNLVKTSRFHSARLCDDYREILSTIAVRPISKIFYNIVAIRSLLICYPFPEPCPETVRPHRSWSLGLTVKAWGVQAFLRWCFDCHLTQWGQIYRLSFNTSKNTVTSVFV